MTETAALFAHFLLRWLAGTVSCIRIMVQMRTALNDYKTNHDQKQQYYERFSTHKHVVNKQSAIIVMFFELPVFIRFTSPPLRRAQVSIDACRSKHVQVCVCGWLNCSLCYFVLFSGALRAWRVTH